MGALIIVNANQLSELRESSERPENYITKPEVMATAYDQALYKRVIEYVDIELGPGRCSVIFSITLGQKNGADALIRHASFHASTGEPYIAFVMMACADLGFTGLPSTWQIVRHPENKNIIVVYQEFK